jgi:hypothetical protein
MKKFLFLFAAALPLACGDDDQDAIDYDYVIFGDYYGECTTDCVHIYKLEADNTYSDAAKMYPSRTAPYEGDYQLLDENIYDEMKDLLDIIPYGALKSHDTTIGEPDAGDWGGIYLAVSVNGEVDYWFIDKKEENLPNNLKPLLAKINEKLLYLRNHEN